MHGITQAHPPSLAVDPEKCSTLHVPVSVEKKDTRKLFIVLTTTVLLMAVEVFAHKKSNSISILSEAVHMLSDTASIFLALIFLKVKAFKSHPPFTFGYARLEVLSSLLSLLLIWVPSLYLINLAVARYASPVPIHNHVLIAVSLLSLFINVLNLLLLHPHSHSQQPSSSPSAGKEGESDMGIHSVYLHILSDLLQTIGVLLTSVILMVYPDLVVVDLICTVVFSILAILYTVPTLKELLLILLEASPSSVNVEEIEKDIRESGKVVEVGEIRAWSISKGCNAVACKVQMDIRSSREYGETVGRIVEVLKTKHLFAYVYVAVEGEGERGENERFGGAGQAAV